MHRFRLVICDSPSGVARAGQALEEAGALPIGPREPCCWVWATEKGLEGVADFSSAHDLCVSFEGFEDFDERLVTGMAVAGDVTVQCRRSVLPSESGSFHDEEGQPLDRALLKWAGGVIASRPPHPTKSTLFCGLEIGLVIGDEIGRFVADTREFLSKDAPSAPALEAITRLAQLALRVSAAGASRSPGELSYLLPLRLTQAVVHAHIDEYTDTPGQADWQWWLGLLVSSAGGLIDDAHMCDTVAPGPDPELVPGLEERNPGKDMELAARSVVTSCVQALALFGSTHRTFANTV